MLYVSIEFEGGYITHIAQSSPIMVDDNVRICVSDWGFEAETGGHTDGRTSDRFYEVSLTELTQKLTRTIKSSQTFGQENHVSYFIHTNRAEHFIE